MDDADADAVARWRRFGDRHDLVRGLAGDLEAVVAKTLAADPEERYASAGPLAEGVGRWLRGEPVEAGPPDALHRLGKLARRHRRLAASVLVVTLALAGAASSMSKRPAPRTEGPWAGSRKPPCRRSTAISRRSSARSG